MGRRMVPAPPGFYGCTSCKRVKPLEEFTSNKRRPFGKGSMCKACKNLYSAELHRRKAADGDEGAEDRFWAKVNKAAPNGCWEWTASLDGRGYGQFWYRGKIHKAYRLSLILIGITPPSRKAREKKVVDHICHNPKCVNPEHLRIVTERENTQVYADRSKADEKRQATLQRLRERGRIRCGCGKELWPHGMGRHRGACPLAPPKTV